MLDVLYLDSTTYCSFFVFQIQFYLYVRCTTLWSKGEVLSVDGCFILFVTKEKYHLSLQDAVEKISVIARV
jgi:hypothetical protein